jgi:hypothetical protein
VLTHSAKKSLPLIVFKKYLVKNNEFFYPLKPQNGAFFVYT